MNVWFTHIGETLPIDGDVRLFRYGILSKMLVSRGHSVTRWAPTFVHATKTLRCKENRSIDLGEGYRIELLHAGGYTRHVGLQRLIFNARLAAAFSRQLARVAVPDIIVAGLPTPEMCNLAVQYGRKHGVPVVVDVRDLWPDIFLDVFPSILKPVVRLGFNSMFRKTRRAFRGATGIFGVSRDYLRWGLAYAGRQQCSTDGVFHLGYPESQIPQERRDDAEVFWESRGVTAERKLRCCYFGSMNKTSDIGTVLQAARLLARDRSNVEFVICGEGPRLDEFRHKSDDLDNILFPGWVNKAEISVLMERSDVGLAAYAENAPQSIPNKPIEYLAGGLAVLSNLSGDFAELLQHFECGRQYRSGDAEGLAGVIKEIVLRGEVLSKMRVNSRMLYERCFDAEKVYGGMIAHLEELVGKWRGGQFEVSKAA